MNSWRCYWKSIKTRTLVSLTILLVLPGCSGGGNDNAWVKIETPTSQSTYQTDQQSVYLDGRSFIPPGSICSGEMFGTVAYGYSVVWNNAANGTSGTANLLYSCFIEKNLTWFSLQSTALELGENKITVTASAMDGTSGQDTITITRVPDVTPPMVAQIWPDETNPVAITATVQISFSEPIDYSTLGNGNLTVRDAVTSMLVGGTFSNSLEGSGTFVLIQPDQPLASGTTYQVHIANVKDLAGNPMTAPFDSTFTTE